MASLTPSKAPDAWQLAVQQYLATLSESQKAIFKAPTSPESCLDMIIRAQSKKKGFTRLIELIRPLIDPLKRFEGAIDVFIQTHGAVASPIWGPLRLAITLACDHFKTLESLAMILHRLISSLERFTGYERLFRSNPAVQRSIGALYSDLIDFCIRVVRFHSRSSMRAMLVSFEKEFQAVSEKINFHSSEIDWVASAADMAESQRAREIEETTRWEQMTSNMQRWLSPSTVQDDLHRSHLEYMPGTCDWILRTSQIQTCLSCDHATAIRIQGQPGSGKTTFTSFLVDYIIEQRLGLVLYFFCKARELEKREPTYILRTLLSQLLQQDVSLYGEIESLYIRSGRPTADSYVDVRFALILALAKCTTSRIFIIVDALDECEDVQSLMQALFDAQKLTSIPAILVVTSRHLPLSFPFEDELYFESQSNSEAIYKYSEHRVSQMRVLNGMLGTVVVREVSRAADGLWLYARLMLDEIEKLPSAVLIQRHLQNVPRGLTQLYSQIIRSKESTLTEMNVKFAQQIYLWLDVNDFLPSFLSMDYLSYDTLSIILQDVNFGEPVFDPPTLASRLCSPLIKFDDSRDSSTFQNDYGIRSSHHTADQYIRESSKLPASSLPLIIRPRRLRQLHRAVTAIWFFTECSASELDLDNYRADPYAETYGSYFEMSYALWSALRLSHLPTDLDYQEITEATDMFQKLICFFDPESETCSRWIESAMIINYAGDWCNLLWNVEDGLSMAQSQDSPTRIAAFDAFNLARLRFFKDYVYVLRLTGPGGYPRQEIIIPDGFQKRPLAMKMLQLGVKWHHLHEPPEDHLRLLEAKAMLELSRQEHFRQPIENLSIERA